MPAAKKGNSFLQSNIRKIVAIVIDSIIIVKRAESKKSIRFFTNVGAITQIETVFQPRSSHQVGSKLWSVLWFFGYDIDESSYCLAPIQTRSGAFDDFDFVDHRIRNSRQTIHRSQSTHYGHAIDSDHRIRAVQPVDANIAGVANIAIVLWTQTIHVLQAFKNRSGGILFQKSGRNDFYWHWIF